MIDVFQNPVEFSGREDFRIIAAVKYNANLLLYLIIQFFFAQNRDRTGLFLDEAKCCIDRSAFSGSIFANQSYNGTAGDGKRNPIQNKVLIGFC